MPPPLLALLQNVLSRAGEMAKSVKYLPLECKALSSDPRIHIKVPGTSGETAGKGTWQSDDVTSV